MLNPQISFYIFTVLVFFLIVIIPAWLLAGYFRKKKILNEALSLVLFEIIFPQTGGQQEEEKKNFKELVAVMEQFYAGMSSFGSYFALEIGLPYFGDEIVFYAAVPKNKSQLFEKQVQGLYPLARTEIKKDDYNIFRPQGYSLGTIIKLKQNAILPIKTYDKFELDPLQIIINVFSKLQKEGEGAALQIIVSPPDDSIIKKAKKAASEMKGGKSFREASSDKSLVGEMIGDLEAAFFSSPHNEKKNEEEPRPVDDEVIKLMENKASKQVTPANIRLVISAEDKSKAELILSELESAFLQFGETQGNSFYFVRPSGRRLKNFFYDFSFRISRKNDAIFLNSTELTSLFHFPSDFTSAAAPQLKYSRLKEAAPPLNLPQAGLLLGKSVFRGEERNVFMNEDDRRRHFYVIGQTGTGKSVLLKNMIAQDIEAGQGVCFIDPHGSDLLDILSRIPKERVDDLIYFNPGDTQRPMGLNMLEYDQNYPEQKTFIVNELLGIFNKLFDMKTAGGPMFEQYFRNAVMLVMDDPASGNTLFEVSRVLSDKAFRELKLSKCANPITKSFWKEVAEKAGGEASLANMVPYITSKFDNFLSNDIMRPIIAQEKSAFNFRKVMDEGKILLVNLSKGRLGDLNSNLLGLVIVGKLLMASLSRADMPESERKDFYLYIDEFQNVTTDSIATILSEARKYKLDLTVAHQYIGQLEESIKKAVFGNVGSMAAFRVGAEDAEFLKGQFEPVFNSGDLINIDNYNAYLKLLIGGQTSRPFNIQTTPFRAGDAERGRMMAQLSSSRYGRTKLEVEEEINKRYNI